MEGKEVGKLVELLYEEGSDKERIRRYIEKNFPVNENPEGLYCYVCQYPVREGIRCEVCGKTISYQLKPKNIIEEYPRTFFNVDGKIYVQYILKKGTLHLNLYLDRKFEKLGMENLRKSFHIYINIKDDVNENLKIRYKKREGKKMFRFYLRKFESLGNYYRKLRKGINISLEFEYFLEECVVKKQN